MTRLPYIVGATVIMTVSHFVAVGAGLYERTVWIVDGPLHVAGGIVLGMFWLWMLQRRSRARILRASPSFLVSFSIVGFALFGSLAWEIIEFFFWKLLPAYANAYKFYSATASDLLSDLAFGFLGGMVVATVYYFKAK